MTMVSRTLLYTALIATTVGSAMAAGETTEWRVGGWSVKQASDDFESRTTMLATVPPDKGSQGMLFLQCDNGRFSVTLVGAGRKGQRVVAAIFRFDGKGLVQPAATQTVITEPGDAAYVTMNGALVETALANSPRVGIRLKGRSGQDADNYYTLKDLGAGKAQLFKNCPVR
jgi:hypothetical protein